MNFAAIAKAEQSPIVDGITGLKDIEAIEARLDDPVAGIRSTYDLLCQGARRGLDAPAMSFFLRTQDFKRPVVWSHREWLAQIRQTANMFRAMGLSRDDVVAFVLPNLPETHWTIWGGEAAGIVFAINPLLEPAMLGELMATAQPKILVTLAPTPGTDIWDKVSQAVAAVPSLQQVLAICPLRYMPGPAGPLLRWSQRWQLPRRLGAVRVSDFHGSLKKFNASALDFEPPQLDDIASYFCTGGTTGLPKIAVRTHRTEVANAQQLKAAFGSAVQGADKPVFCGLPLFHVNAQIGTGLTIWGSGAHVVLGTPQGYRAPGLLTKFWDIAAHYRFIFFSGVPTVYSALLQTPPKGQDLHALRFGICGAAPMPAELFNRFEAETGIKILEGYGLTEGGCVSSINPPNGPSLVGSIGIRMPWQPMLAVILGDEGAWLRDADIDEPGVLIVRGPNLFKGYLNPKHNEGLWISRPGADGKPEKWLNTGDLGRMDAKGYFWLTGRKKELIIRGGHNIDPKLIEEVMHKHPAVALASAIGRPDAHAGEVPVVYVQLRPGLIATEDELIRYAQMHVSERAAWPKQVFVVATMPTTAIGKIHKPSLTSMQLESVVRMEAETAHIELTLCKAEQDPKLGLVVRWRAQGNTMALRERLSHYTFQHIELTE